VTLVSQDRFWRSRRAWSYAAAEGFRAAAIIASTILVVGSFAGLVRGEGLVDWLVAMAKISLLMALPVFLVFAIWARCELWRNNRMKPR
jgi:hypothetical protein